MTETTTPTKKITLEVKPRWSSEVFGVEIEPKKSIRLFGTFKNLTKGPRPYDKTFKIGDWVEYDSYNLKYIGTIVSIGPKTVTIAERYGNPKQLHRLDLANFANRNWDFDFAEVNAYNAEESQYI